MTYLTEDEIKALLDGTTPGPLTHASMGDKDPECYFVQGPDLIEGDFSVQIYTAGHCTEEDARLYAAAPTLATQCLAQSEAIKAKDAEIERLALQVARVASTTLKPPVDRPSHDWHEGYDAAMASIAEALKGQPNERA